MGTLLPAVRVGIGRGWIEFRQSLFRVEELIFNVLISGVILVALYFLRDHTIPGFSLSLATAALPGVVGSLIAFNALTGGAFVVAFEREDGTLLRAKAVPYGVVGYFTGQVVRIPLNTVLSVLFVLVPGLFLFDGLRGAGLAGWATFCWVLVLGLLATIPIGMALGGLARNPRIAPQLLGLASMVLVAISGIFYPITALPSWLHPIAQVFPFYWLGIGMRSALLPDPASAAELYGSWQHPQTAAVLAAWAVAGLLLAPPVLRRMARRESGASVEVGRQQAAQRIG